jgi:GT2 family glycosyltransferase
MSGAMPEAHSGSGTASPTPRHTGVAGELTYSVGVVNYRTYADLERCLESLARQDLAPRAIVVVDASEDPERLESMRERHQGVIWEGRPNRGFAAGANSVLERIDGAAPESEFVLILNPDVELEPDYVSNLLSEMRCYPEVALASGKLVRPDTNLIDSAGIRLPRHRRPRDRGSEEPDRGQYDRTEFVFGVSGAAVMMRRSALSDLAIEGEVFDEDFFLYHEDTDVSWRANLLGWRVLYVPTARAKHARRWRRSGRFLMDEPVRRHSFKNHYLQMIKNERVGDFLINLPAIAFWEIGRLGFAVLRDRAMLSGYREAWQLGPRAWHKRRLLQHRARARSKAARDDILVSVLDQGQAISASPGDSELRQSEPLLRTGN